MKSYMPDIGCECQLSSRANLRRAGIIPDGYWDIRFESPVQFVDSLLRGLNSSAHPIWWEAVLLDGVIRWVIDVALTAPSGPILFAVK
jgi:hypothetical protein